ncbi:MAG: amidohydrolase family protein, partial [Chthoniobacterales bacterium]
IDLQDADANALVLAAPVAQHIAFDFARGRRGDYPSSLMGCIALIRQTWLDAGWYLAAQQAYSKNPAATERPEANASLAALADFAPRKQPTVFETEDEEDLLRALKIADEFKLKPILLGNGYEYRVRQSLKKTPVILTLAFPDVPEVENPQSALDYDLHELQHWDRAPSNPALLAEAGIPLALTTEGLEKPEKEFWPHLRLAVRRGLSEDAALAALTSGPAEMFGVSDRMGTIAPGRIANLVITNGDLFADKNAKVLTTWVDGHYYETDLADERDARGTWELSAGDKTLPLVIEGELDKPEAKIGDEKIVVTAKGDAIGLVAPAKLFEQGEGVIRFSGRITADKMEGDGDGPQATSFTWTAKRTAAYTPKPAEEKPSPRDQPLDFPETFPAGAFGRTGIPPAPATVLIQGATIWTSGPQGTLQNADLLVTNGKITAVGPGLKAPGGATVIDGKNLQVTPGVVDCHSHTAISKGVNESTHAVTCEVRIGDVVDATDIAIYRELAGGTTTANLLHGSANPIGGQNQVVKFRWGALPEEMKFEGAMPGVKFALGENVKQSNWGDEYTTRYPQTRMGVEELMRDRFRAAQEYEATLKRKGSLPVRRNLQLEALAEVLAGKRIIHCHSYRQDEVLMLLHLA